MTLVEKIKALYPELKDSDFLPIIGTVLVQNNSDGNGDYLAKWDHPTFARPTEEQLA